jgi:hypothetical protein
MPRLKNNKKPKIYWGRWLVAILLMVPNVFFSLVLARDLEQFKLTLPVHLAFITGAGVYFVMHLLLWKPIFMHVMGHELTHAFWAVLLGGKIKSLQVSSQGGQVTLSKTNFFIALAPYFFPLYTFMLIPIYFIAAVKYYPILAFAIGFTLAFHVALTLHSLRDHQSDIREVGRLFSFSFVYLMNLLVIAIVVAVVAPDVIQLPRFLLDTSQDFIKFILWTRQQFFSS